MRRILWLLPCVLACSEEDTPEDLADVAPPGSAVCAFDDLEDPESAEDVALAAPTRGAICPLEDVDWYRFSLSQGVLAVQLEMDPPVSPVEPAYVVRAAQGGSAGDVVATPRPEELGGRLALNHCLPAGDYFIAVRDAGDDDEDRRAEYVLTLAESADPDANEPNQQADSATPLAAQATGYLACRGDSDWYAVDVADQQILDVQLTMPVTTVEPRLRFVNPAGDTVFDETFGAAGRTPTDLRRAVSVAEGGRWLVVVSDAGDDGQDLDTPYTLTVQTQAQLDENEPNDTAATATEQAAVECTDAWTPWVEVRGTVGTLGDPDWFRIPVTSCGRGLIEAEVTLDADPTVVQASVALVRPDGRSPCEMDEDCTRLERRCESGWDCAGYFNTCLQGRCAGATACLQEEICGAFVTERHYVAADASGPNQARLSAPVFTGAAMYLRVGDFRGDGAAPDAFYTLRYRLRDDPDRNEPSNVYTPNVMGEDPTDIQVALAVRENLVPVHDCTAELVEKGLPDAGAPDMMVDAAVDAAPDAAPDLATPDAALPDAAPDAGVPDAAPDVAPPDAALPDLGVDLDAGADAAPPPDAGPDMGADMAPEQPVLVPGCCGPNDWTEGWISYEGDSDWYAYAHPCPGEDCMVRILYEIDEGPVDMLWQVHEGSRLWFDTVVAVDEAENQRRKVGAFGGVEAADQCFYAFSGHNARGDNRFHYALRIRDLLPVVDWSAGQRYRFCVEKVAAGCAAPPCRVAENGECDAP